jgi:two-component system sensor histidine kinase RpfC
MIDFSILDHLDGISQSRDFVNRLIDDFPAEAAAVISRIELALGLQRPAEAKQLAHALKGTALGIGATALGGLCEHINTIAVSELVQNATSVIGDLRVALSETEQQLIPYRIARHGARPAKHFH